jgi:hypothetical protein
VPISAAGTVYYVANSGSDRNDGTSPSTPWQTVAQVIGFQANLKPGDQVLFERGSVWHEDLILTNVNGTPSQPIVFSAYGTGSRPLIDGSSSTFACVEADQSRRSTNVSYVTIDGFECRNTTDYGIDFMVESTSGMPGITISNNYIHNTGPGACAGCGTPNDPGGYRNQLNFEDDTTLSGGGTNDGVRILNNTVNNCGGHNCLQVHGDLGGFLVQGNTVGDGCVHGCLDVKMGNGTIDQNVVTCPTCVPGAPCYYTENTDAASETLLYTRNIAYSCSQVGFQAEDGGTCNAGTCSMNLTYYNNTAYVGPNSINWIDSSCSNPTTVVAKNNIVDGGQFDIHSNCSLIWDFNDNGGSQGGGGSGAPTGGHNLQDVDPRYVNAAGNDFHLQAGSPLLNAGQPGLVGGINYIGALP